MFLILIKKKIYKELYSKILTDSIKKKIQYKYGIKLTFFLVFWRLKNFETILSLL